jgi:hypothetical protein
MHSASREPMDRVVPHMSIEGAEFFLARDQLPETD